MAVTDFSAAFGVSPKVAATLITALEKRGAYVLADADDSRTVTMGNCLYLIFNGRLFHYDATDATTAHDGVTCCVSFEGKRYKADAFGGGLLRIFSIQSKTLTAPPVSPTIGQQWIVAVGGTGLWAGKDNYIASWTARGWVFTVPSTYDLAMNAADTKYYNFAVSNTWVAGLPAVVLGPSTISPSALKYGRFGLAVVNQTTNAPPVSPADGDAYVIGASPTGAWAANARNIAIYETSAWVIYPAVNGNHVYDASLGLDLIYSTVTNVWSTKTGYAAVLPGTPGSKSGFVSITGSYVWSAGTAPTTSNTNIILSQAYTAKKAAAILKITVSIDNVSANDSKTGNPSATVTLTTAFGIFVDSTANASEWQNGPGAISTITTGTSVTDAITITGPCMLVFLVTAPDTASHTYTLRAGKTGTCSVAGVRIIVEELA